MNKRAVAVVILCSSVLGCTIRDTNRGGEWSRAFEPRLSGPTEYRPCTTRVLADHAVPVAQCGPPLSDVGRPEPCPGTISRAQADRILRTRPDCTDSAIATLKRVASSDPEAKNDLAVAYYNRAQFRNRFSDLFLALDTAQEAVEARADFAPARFNLALIEEALGLSHLAKESWDAYVRMDRSPWAREGRAHLRRLQERVDAGAEWDRQSAVLDKALAAGDAQAIRRVVEAFPYRAQKYLEDNAGKPDRKKLDLLAAELLRRNGDPFAVDLLHAPNGEPRQLLESIANAALQQDMQRSIDGLQAPLRLTIENGYRHVEGRILGTRAFFRWRQSHYQESLTDFDAALAIYQRLDDRENVANMRVGRIGVLTTLGYYEAAAREALPICRSSPLTVLGRLHELFGDMGVMALELDRPRAALLYQEELMRIIDSRWSLHSESIASLKTSTAIAKRARAGIQVRLGHLPEATKDLEDAKRIAQELGRKDLYDAIDVRIQRVAGEALLKSNPDGAVAAFTRALQLGNGESYTFQATLMARRAEAHQRAGRRQEAERDLRDSLRVLRTEESEQLKHRRRGDDDGIWSPYFQRFQSTYRQLIRQLVEQHRWEEAFAYAERARAFEPLDLVLKLKSAPPELRRIAEMPEKEQIAAIRALLPAGTFLIEFCVLDDRTYTWIVSRDAFRLLEQPVGRTRIEEWTAGVQRAVEANDPGYFASRLSAPSAELFEAPLNAILAMPNGRNARLVFIPDGAIHGFPFAALRSPAGGEYLIDDFIISVAGSSLLYAFSLLRDRDLAADRSISMLAIGNPDFDRTLPGVEDMGDLPKAREEAEALRRIYGPGTEVLIGDDATVAELLRRARDKTIVHIAAHAIVNPDAPQRSLLLLAKSGEDRGAIDAEQLTGRLHLDHARLFVLGTCSGAGGAPVGPEGLGPLVRPIIGAGTPAVVGSLWKISDATTKELLVSFHQQYGKGSDAAEALRKAQLKRKQRRNDPTSIFGWAAFQVIGYARSPSAPGESKEQPP